MKRLSILPLALTCTALLFLAACQSNTSASVSTVHSTIDSMPSKADILDFATDLMTQYEAAARPYFVALDSVWDEIELQEGEEMTSLDDFAESRQWNQAGIQTMRVASPSFVKRFNQRVDSVFALGQNWNFGSAFLGSTIGIGMEKMEFPTELHETIQYSEDHNQATFRLYLISEHDNYPPDAQVLITCSRKDAGWLLEDAKMLPFAR